MLMYLVASKATDSVTHGFLPAARELGLDVVILTDRPAEHANARVQACRVDDVRELIATLADLPAADAVFSNSDNLQVQTALAADYFGLPGKDWRAAARAKNKALMRRHLATLGAEQVRARSLRPGGPLPDDLRYPVVLKPAEGVASEDVYLIDHPGELKATSEDVWTRRPGETLLAEEYLPGELRTVETLGDGATIWTLGGFRTRVAPPRFVEERLDFDPRDDGRVLAALEALKATFGACHTEHVSGHIIEVNDRAIGDHCDFLLSRVTGLPIFDLILRVHLGEPLPQSRPPGEHAHGAADYVIATRSGLLTRAPERATHRHGGATVEYWPVRRPGDYIRLTGTNRDYLGTILAHGRDRREVDQAIAAFRKDHRWVIE